MEETKWSRWGSWAGVMGKSWAHNFERECPHMESGRGGASKEGPKMASEFG